MHRDPPDQNFAGLLQTEIAAKKSKKHDFYLGIKPASWGKTELRGSEYTPPGTFKPPRTAGGGYKDPPDQNFAGSPANRFLSCIGLGRSLVTVMAYKVVLGGDMCVRWV